MQRIAPIAITVSTSLLLPRHLTYPQITLRELSIDEISKIFGIENVEYDSDGRIIKCLESTTSLQHMGRAFNASQWQGLRASRYCFEINADDEEYVRKTFEKINFCLRILIGEFASICFIKKRDNNDIFPSETYIYPFPNFSKKPTLSDELLTQLSELFQKLEDHPKLKKLNILEDLTSYAFSHVEHKESMIIALFTILEAIYVNDQQELGYKLRMRSAKALNRDYGFVEKMKVLYSKRGKLVHGGENQFTEEDGERLKNLAQESIKKFILEPAFFDNIDQSFF